MICLLGRSVLLNRSIVLAVRHQMDYCSLDVVSTIPTGGARRIPTISIMEDDRSAHRLPYMYSHSNLTEAPLFAVFPPESAGGPPTGGPTTGGSMCTADVAGYLDGSVCCPTTCGGCGGSGCSGNDGGEGFTGGEACCGSGVKKLGRVCSASVGAPCVVE